MSWRVIAAWLECFPEKPSSCRNKQVCQWRATSVKRFERSNGLDTALYKNYLYLFTWKIIWLNLLNHSCTCLVLVVCKIILLSNVMIIYLWTALDFLT